MILLAVGLGCFLAGAACTVWAYCHFTRRAFEDVYSPASRRSVQADVPCPVAHADDDLVGVDA